MCDKSRLSDEYFQVLDYEWFYGKNCNNRRR